jgi:glycosyltransferase involved in cell wall biosynthesis
MKILMLQESDWFIRGPHNQQHLAEKLSLRSHDIKVIDHDILWRRQNNKSIYSPYCIFHNVSRIYDGARINIIRPGFIRIPVLDYISLLFSHRKEIRKQITEFAPDVIVGFGILNSLLAALEVRQSNIPFVYYWIDLLHTLIPFKLFQPLGVIVEKITLRISDMVIATNKSLRNVVIRMGAQAERTHILGFGINPEEFNPNLDSDSIKKQYGIQNDDIVLCFVGVLNSFTGVREVALKLASIDNPRLKALIVGDGASEYEIRQLQKRYNLQSRLIITGKKPYHEIPYLLAASDVCLLPFHNIDITNKIVPLKIFDYMAMKKPIVSTRLPGVLEEFGEDNGIVYVNNPADVVEKAMDLVTQGTVKELGIKAREFVEGKSWDKITDQFESILKQAIARKKVK